MEKNSDANEKYFNWQERFLRCYYDSNPRHGLLDELIKYHPGIDLKESQESHKKLISGRMRNYTRRLKDKKMRSGYARIPGLDDLYALCRVKNVTPNAILLDYKTEIKEDISVYRIFQEIPACDPIIRHFKITERKLNNNLKAYADPKFVAEFTRIMKENFKICFRFSHRNIRTKSFGKTTYKVCEDDTELDAWITAVLEMAKDSLKISKMSNASLELLIDISALKDIAFTGSHFTYDWEIKDFELFEYSKYNQWSKEKQFVAALNSYVFICCVQALRAICDLEVETMRQPQIMSYYADYFSANPIIRKFMLRSLCKSFIAINQNATVSFSGILYSRENDLGIRMRHGGAEYRSEYGGYLDLSQVLEKSMFDVTLSEKEREI